MEAQSPNLSMKPSDSAVGAQCYYEILAPPSWFLSLAWFTRLVKLRNLRCFPLTSAYSSPPLASYPGIL